MKFYQSAKFKISSVYAATVLLLCLFYWTLFFGFTRNLLESFPDPLAFEEADEESYIPSYNDESYFSDELSVSEFDTVTDEQALIQSEQTEKQKSDIIDKQSNLESLVNNYTEVIYIIEERLPLISFLLALIVSLLSFGVGYLFSIYVFSPIKRLQSSINQIELKRITASDKLDISRRKDEFGKLAESYNKMIGRVHNSYIRQKQFVQDASHELKTPLSIIQTNSELLEKSLPNLSNEDELTINAIKKSVERMAKLINNLLLLEKIEYVKKRKNLDLTAIIKEIKNEFNGMIKHKNVKCDISFHKTQLPFRANQQLIERLFRNLISNAVKYTSEGKLEIKSYEVGQIISQKKLSSQLINPSEYEFGIEIKDTGIGMTKEDIKKIGHRFFRGEKSRSRSTGGSGLGMAIVNKIADTYNINISIQSKKNKGTKILLLFPVDPQ
jgi:signal transduction histidine kinase